MTRIHLPLTQQNAQRLEHCLARLLQLSPDDADDLQLLAELLQQAQHHAVQQQQCPICKDSFAQNKPGRNGIYCSNACKQKAYRQRVNARKRQYRPPKRT
ncbi:hypothetical protein KFU94_48110 [Chloroflexi bacterium TSY]|nr:hypothetical protein [Chloroflexi bacterium TSY]